MLIINTQSVYMFLEGTLRRSDLFYLSCYTCYTKMSKNRSGLYLFICSSFNDAFSVNQTI
jgi:hypothetical protein